MLISCEMIYYDDGFLWWCPMMTMSYDVIPMMIIAMRMISNDDDLPMMMFTYDDNDDYLP